MWTAVETGEVGRTELAAVEGVLLGREDPVPAQRMRRGCCLKPASKRGSQAGLQRKQSTWLLPAKLVIERQEGQTPAACRPPAAMHMRMRCAVRHRPQRTSSRHLPHRTGCTFSQSQECGKGLASGSRARIRGLSRVCSAGCSSNRGPPDVHVEGARPCKDARAVHDELGAAGGGDDLRQRAQRALEGLVPVARQQPRVAVLVVWQPVELVQRLLDRRKGSGSWGLGFGDSSRKSHCC